jgi:hypothetical protein
VDGVVSPRIMYGLWWLVGLLPVIYDLLARAERGHEDWDLVQNVIRRVYLIAPWCMLVIHMGFSHWAHHSDFHLADVAPPLLGLAIASTRLTLESNLRLIARVLPALALILTFMVPAGPLQWPIPFMEEARTVTPAFITIAATILTYGYMASMFHLLCAALTLFLIGTGFLFETYVLAALRAAIRFIVSLLPTTVYAWGITAILLAFLLLGAGTFWSLKRTRTEPTA